jgi:hypothetical protein
VRSHLEDDDEGRGAVLDLCDTDLVADHLAMFVAVMLTAARRGEARADPQRVFARWEKSFGPDPGQRVPRAQPPAQRYRGDTARDAIALIEAVARGDDAAGHSVLAVADHLGLALQLASMCADLGADHPDDLAGWLATWRRAAERMDEEI